MILLCVMCLLSSETMRAPGADDNGSGTSAMLEIASIIKNMHADTPFKRGKLTQHMRGKDQVTSVTHFHSDTQTSTCIHSLRE